MFSGKSKFGIETFVFGTFGFGTSFCGVRFWDVWVSNTRRRKRLGWISGFRTSGFVTSGFGTAGFSTSGFAVVWVLDVRVSDVTAEVARVWGTYPDSRFLGSGYPGFGKISGLGIASLRLLGLRFVNWGHPVWIMCFAYFEFY